MNLHILEPTLSVVKLPITIPIPSWALQSDFFSITRTDEELSIVCSADHVPLNHGHLQVEPNWRCIKIEGFLDFQLVGILASLTAPLAEHEISIFAISTYNTDYLLVKSDTLDKAQTVLENEGHIFI